MIFTIACALVAAVALPGLLWFYRRECRRIKYPE
jgi:hypothetical protein